MANLRTLLALVSVAAAAPLLRAQLTTSSSADYSTGKYGQSTATDIYTAEVSGEYVYKDWTGNLDVYPYERITGPGNVLPKIGLVGGKRAVVGSIQTRETNQGFGDIDLSAGYDAYHDDANGWDILATGEVKFGTASEAKGLGTGRTDYSPSIDVARSLGKFTPWISFGYWQVGKAPGLELLDYWYGSAGLTYDFTDRTNATLSYDTSERASLAADVDNDVSVEVDRKLNGSWTVKATVLAGLSTAAPAVELTGAASYKF